MQCNVDKEKNEQSWRCTNEMSEISSCEEDGGNDGECRGEGGW